MEIALRETISAPVTEALVKTENSEVVETVLKNQGAAFSGDTLAVVVE